MAFLAAALPYITMGAGAVGTVMQTIGQRTAAKNTEKVADYNAKIANQAAGQEKAASQFKAIEVKRQARLKQSRVLALASASGGGTMDMDVMNAIAGFEEEGDLAARMELYQGTEASKKLKAQGRAGIWQGKMESNSLKNKSYATIMGGVSSLASKYGSFLGGGGGETKIDGHVNGMHYGGR